MFVHIRQTSIVNAQIQWIQTLHKYSEYKLCIYSFPLADVLVKFVQTCTVTAYTNKPCQREICIKGYFSRYK